MDKPEKPTMHPRTDTWMQPQFLKGTYHNEYGKYDDNLLQAVSVALEFVPDDVIQKKVHEFNARKARLSYLEDRMIQSDASLVYIELREQKEMNEEINRQKTTIPAIKYGFIRYLIRALQSEKKMEKVITKMQLDQLPLVAGGIKETPTGEDTGDDDFDEDEDLDYG